MFNVSVGFCQKIYKLDDAISKLISSGSEFESRMGYSRAAVDNNYVFASGYTGSDYQAMSISNYILEQAEPFSKH